MYFTRETSEVEYLIKQRKATTSQVTSEMLSDNNIAINPLPTEEGKVIQKLQPFLI